MLAITDIVERAEKGRPLGEEEFDLGRVAAAARRLAREAGIRYDPGEIIPADDDLCERLYAAGFQMAVEVGIYCRSTGRVMEFTADEIQEALNAAPRAVWLGEGRDARLLACRDPGSPEPPLVFGGQAGAPIPEEIFLRSVMAYAREPLVDALDHGSITVVDGHEVRTGSPLEITATRRELAYLREGIREAGRPGMPLIAAESSATSLGDLAVAHPAFLRPTDVHLIPILSELKTDWHNLGKVANFVEYGGLNGNLPNPMVGGYAGGPEGTAIATVAAFILGVVVNQAHLHLCHPVHIRYTSTSTPEVMWVINVVGRAFARRRPLILLGDIFATNGAGTAELLYEVAANAICNVTAGMHLLGVAAVNGKLPNGSPLETRLMAEVGRRVAGLGLGASPDGRRRANELVRALLGRYAHTFAQPREGGRFDQVYDPLTLKPTAAWEETYRCVKEELAQLGLPL